jgi:hypothetical protein
MSYLDLSEEFIDTLYEMSEGDLKYLIAMRFGKI